MSALTSLADGWAALAWSATWQLAALALLALLCERAFRLRQPRARHALWCFVLMAPLLLAPGRLMLAHRNAALSVPVPASAARAVAQMPQVAAAPLRSVMHTAVPAAPEPHPDTTFDMKVARTDILALTWLVGCALLALRLVMGHRRMRGMLAESRRIENTAALEALRALCAEAGVRTGVELRSSDLVAAPVLYGLRRSVVLVPEDWLASLAPDELRALLAHEVAHVRRRDVWANLVQRLVEIPLFFHPGAWLASRRITLAREDLCDAWAIGQGADAAAYARSLAAAAERAYASVAAASLGVAESRFTLLKRVEAIMETGTVKRLRRPLAAALATVLLISAGAFAAVRLGGQEPESSGMPAVAAKPSSDSLKGSETARPGQTVHVSGHVTDEQGRPVEGAGVWMYAYQHEDIPFYSGEIGRTGGDGRFSADVERKSNIRGRPWTQPWGCWIAAHKQGHGVGWTRLIGAERLEEARITLGPTGVLRGRVMDADGQLLSQVTVALDDIAVPSRTAGPSAFDKFSFDPFSKAPTWSQARTNEHGVFTLAGLPADATVDLDITTCGAGPSYRKDQIAPRLDAIKLSEQRGELAVRLVRQPIIEGYVRFAGPKGRPAAGVAVGAMGLWDKEPANHYSLETVTDPQGHYRFDNLLPGKARYTVSVWDQKGAGFIPKPIVAGPGERVQAATIVLTATGWIEGRVLDADTGQPISGVEVFTSPPLGFPQDLARPGRRIDDPLGKTGDDGHFRLWSPSGRVPIMAEPAGDYSWSYQTERVSSGGRTMIRLRREAKPSERFVEVKPGATIRSVTLYLGHQAEVAGMVVGPEGKPWGSGYVMAVLDRESVLSDSWTGGSGTVQPDGTFRVRKLVPGGPVRLSLFDDGSRMGGGVIVTPVQDEVRQVKIEMRPAPRVIGRAVLPDGKPAAGADIWCQDIGGARTRCDANGRFEAQCGLNGLPCTLFARLPAYQPGSERPAPPKFSGESRKFEAAPGQEVVDVGDIVMKPWKLNPVR